MGNVRAVVSDVKVPTVTNNTVTDLTADVVSATDYYPFGMQMPGRSFSSNAYRYGFNGMEKDDEVKGEGNSYTTHWRQYDPRLGRWLSIDPEMSQFASWSPYNSNFNNPIANSDPNGNCPWCAVVSGLWEYGTQVYGNYQNGDSGYDAWIGKVDFVDVVVEAGTNLIPGGKLLKGAVTIGGEFLKEAVDLKGSGEFSHIGDGSEDKSVTNVVVNSSVNSVVNFTGEKVGDVVKKIGGSDKLLETALKNKEDAYKNLNKANNVSKYGGGNRTKAMLPNEALKNVNQADKVLQATRLGNKTLGTDAGQTIVDKSTQSSLKNSSEKVKKEVKTYVF